MALHVKCIFLFFVTITICMCLHAEWIEITQKSTPNPDVKPKSSIRILKKSEVENLFNFENGTPSPQWVAYQNERFGQQKHNTDSQKLVVITENKMKNSAKVIVPANNNNLNINNAKHHIIKTKTSVNVIDAKPNEELPHLETQTTTKRDMNHDYSENGNDEKGEEAENDSSGNELEIPSWQGFLKFVKRIQKYWIKHAGQTLNQKINYLKRLRDKLKLKIEEQFDALWPKDSTRRKRSLLGESKISFPPVFALMSINFLTFAVFLIKLVLHVTNILKSKHYQISGLGLLNQPLVKRT